MAYTPYIDPQTDELLRQYYEANLPIDRNAKSAGLSYRDILKKYWGYDSFRPMQEEIITSIGSGKDTLALLPTGGGKSITFQVPTMAKDGVCLVITPLVSLMKDQVENLQRLGIKAAYIHSGMEPKQVYRVIENACYDAYKFLYISPERLSLDSFRNNLFRMDICMIAVDESHCISQWGYDFRPSYLKISEIRDLLKHTPVLALTATATPEVVDDIQEKLKFKEKNVFRKTFLRKNLSYLVRQTDDKIEYIKRILDSQQGQGSSIVYVRSRKLTEEVAARLNSLGISAESYHAGLEARIKDEKQNKWKNGSVRVIVATNAFGMGIDKGDVRTVIHYNLPENLEAYFQEAGRAGRDEKDSFAILLYDNKDFGAFRKHLLDEFPLKDYVRIVYDEICRYLNIPIYEGAGWNAEIDLWKFCKERNHKYERVESCLNILSQNGYLAYSPNATRPSRLMFNVRRDDLYSDDYDTVPEFSNRVMETVMRLYPGVFADYVHIDETEIAHELGVYGDSRQHIYNALQNLRAFGIIKYVPGKQATFIEFLVNRQEPRHVAISKESYEIRKERAIYRMENMIQYVRYNTKCRSQMLLHYFGDVEAKPCGTCDVCRELGKKSPAEIQSMQREDFRTSIKLRIHLREGNINEATLRHIYQFRLADFEREFADMKEKGIITSNEGGWLYCK